MVTRGEKLIDGLVGSAVWGVPELFGVTPPKYVQEFRQDNPVMGFGSSMVSDIVPYAGWYAATKKIKRLDDIIKGIGDVSKAPVRAGAMQEAARFMPLELARGVGGLTIGDQGFGEVIGQAALNTALAGGTGALGGFLRASGKRTPTVREELPGLNEIDPPQLQLRALRVKAPEALDGGIASVASQDAAAVSARSVRLRELIRQEDPTDGQYIGKISTGSNEKLNSLFNDSGVGGLTKKQSFSKKLVASEGHFKTDLEWQRFLGQNGIDPTDFEEFAQYPRVVGAKDATGNAYKKLSNTLRQNMTDIGDGWLMAQEADDGMFLMAKKNQKDASYTVFKTDSPDRFRKADAQFASGNVKANAWTQEGKELFENAGPVFKAFSDYRAKVSLQNYLLADGGLAEGSKKGWEQIDRIKGLMGLEGKSLKDSEAVARVNDMFKEYFTPTMFQTKGSPRATYILGTARMLRDTAEGLAQQRFVGKFPVEKNKSLMAQSLSTRPANAEGGLYSTIDSLDEGDVKQLWQLYVDDVQPDALLAKYAEGGISEKTLQAAQRLMAEFDEVGDMVQQAERAVGMTDFKKRRNYIGIARDWDGDLRIRVVDQAGRTKGIASGYNNSNAEANLRKMLDKHPDWREAERFNVSEQPSNPVSNGAALPGWARQRQGVEGFRFNYTPFTKQELLDEVKNSLYSRFRHQADLAITHGLRSEMAKLQLDDSLMHRIAQTRLNDLMGKQRPFATWQNKMADRVLGPVLGTNSASKIVGVTNNLMWNLELGGFRLGYIISNLLTPLQTVTPELAYVMNARVPQLGDHYSYFAAMGSKGPVGSMGVLEPLKVMGGALKAMRKPDDQLTEAFERAVNDRIISPQVVEENIGESATRIADYRKALGSPGGFASWTRAVWEYLPTQTERFSRAYGFTTGHYVATKVLGMADPEEAYQFARQFTSRTMYEYTQADRASIITGPLGSSFGLFKNWMMHYVGQMLEYTGEGVKRGNWAPLMWQQFGTLSLGGIAATPLYAVASEANDWISDTPLMENAYEMLGTEGADSLFYGLPATMGLSLSSQVSSPLANPIRDAGMLFSAVHMDRAKYIAQAAGTAFDHWQLTGEHPAASEHVREQLIRGFAPKTIYRLFQSMGDSGIESLNTGYPVLKDASIGQRVLFASGLNPTEIDRTYAVADILYRDQEKRRAMVAAAGIAYNEAIEARDSQAAWMVLRGAMRQGMDPSSILRSAAGRNQAGNERMLERTFSPENVARFRATLGY